MDGGGICLYCSGKGCFPPKTKETIAAEICMLIQNNDHRLRLLHSEIIMLSQRNEELGRNLASLTSPPDTAPNYRLPSEVLSQIFGMALEDESFNVSDTKKGPWVLSHVCRPWRSAACGDPTLWTSITVGDSSVHVPVYSAAEFPTLSYITKPRKDPISLLSTVLSHSNERDLSVVFNISSNKVDIQTKSTIIALLKKVMEHSGRWKDISICVPLGLVRMLNSVEGDVSHLKKLHLIVSDVPAVLLLSIRAFKAAPALKEISFEGLGAENFKDLPWSQVTSLTDVRDRGGSYMTYTGILSSAPHLHTLVCKYRFELYLSIDGPGDRILHVGLKSLTVCFKDFMERVELPQLTSLTVTPPLADRDINNHINALITSSGCQLQFLHIDFAIIDNDFFGILDATPRLVHLKLNYPHWLRVYDQFFSFARRMAEYSDDGEHELLTALQSLEITLQKDEDSTATPLFGLMDPEMVEMVISRWSMGALKLFRFESDTTRVLEDLTIEDVAELKQAKEDGLDISVITTSKQLCYTTGHWDLRFDQEDHRRVYV
ncbi:hypothetical protein F5146DRAFT_1124920 [Armillaria mellea]|nr:hypothetical protein F5146DRAFT_1086182 [Armillaria mellea]KAK0185451.1 hypothetical protein F5146DRAFT_1124920 [Armillaria mellea]